MVDICFEIPLNPKKFINNQLEKITNIITDKNEEFKGEIVQQPGFENGVFEEYVLQPSVDGSLI